MGDEKLPGIGLYKFATRLDANPKLREILTKSLGVVAPTATDESPERRVLDVLGGNFASDPVVLAGIRSERGRLGTRPWILCRVEDAFDLDGQTTYLALLGSFEERGAGEAALEIAAAAYPLPRDRNGAWAASSSNADPRVYRQFAAPFGPIDTVLRELFYRGGDCHSLHARFLLIGPIPGGAVSAAFLCLVREADMVTDFELASHFETVGQIETKLANWKATQFDPSADFLDCEGVPVTFNAGNGVPHCAAWDVSPPRHFDGSSALRNGGRITEAEFRKWVECELMAGDPRMGAPLHGIHP